MRWVALLVAVTAVGCADYSPEGSDTVKPGQPEAQRIAWDAFGMPGEPSRVYWVEGDALDCAGGTGWIVGKSQCIGGRTWDEFDWSDVAWWPSMKFSDGPVEDPANCDSCMVHEMGHVAAWLKFHDVGGHRAEVFAPGGWVDKANAALADAGL
jgi:hypothetical protein